MGSTISPIVANLFIEEFEINHKHCYHPPTIWLRYVDDTLIIQKAEHIYQFIQHINSIDAHIQFTTESLNTDGFICFLDILVSLAPDNTLLTTFYRKLTHTDLYLHCDNNHNLSARYSVFSTFTYRCRTVYSPHNYCTMKRNT